MKKMFLVGLVLAVAATTGMAGIGIDWHTINGVVASGQADNVLPPPGGFLLDGYSAIWQLIYAGANDAIDQIDNSQPAMDPTAWAANNYLRPGGDDELMAQRTIALGGGIAAEDSTAWNNWMVNTGGNTVYELLADGGETWWGDTGGIVYQRIFQVGSMGVPTGSTWFYQTPGADVLALDTTYVTGGFAQDFPVADNTTFGVPTYQVNTIPEPATMGLLGLGALVMAIRRRRS